MRKAHFTALLATLLLAPVLGACAGFRAARVNPSPSAPPDPCAPQNLPVETEKLSALMREFDDASFVAQYTPNSQLGPAILELQRIRRAAEDQVFPACLTDLKRYQLEYMNATIVTLAILMAPDPRPEVISGGILRANEAHNQYQLELARLFGVTLVVQPTAAGPSATAAVSAPPTETATASVALVSNPGPTTLNLRLQPALESNTLGILEVGQTAGVLGKTPDELWYLIEMPGRPGETAWVYASLVQLSVPATSLPAVTPAP